MGKEADFDEVTVSVHSVEEPWTPNQSTTWGNDIVETRSKSWSWAWTSKHRTTEQAVVPAIRSSEKMDQRACKATWLLIRNGAWPILVRVFTAKKQWVALFMFSSCAVVPMFLLGWFTPKPGTANGTLPPFYNVFAAKTMGCGYYIDDTPANSTVTGIEGLFVLDQTYGRLPFSTVKTIDVAWDILVGRGVQMLAWWAAYIVFSDALLCVIERHPASLRIFQRIALEGPGLLSLLTLCKELFSVKSKRTRILFVYMLLSTCYVLSIPMFLAAMTGYASTSIAWMDPDDSNNLVPSSAVKWSWAISGTRNATFDEVICSDPENAAKSDRLLASRLQHCACQLANGTLAPPDTLWHLSGDSSLVLRLKGTDMYSEDSVASCKFNYEGSQGTFTQTEYSQGTKEVTYNCNEPVIIDVNGQSYDIQDLNGTYSLCYNHKAYTQREMQGRSRCLPDTANPSYQWGFSTMLSGIFVFTHFGWCLSMYIVWLDAQCSSSLIKEGYEMTPLRAAFAIAKAVKRKTGLGEGQLVRHDTKDLDKELYGVGKKKGTRVDYSVFVANAEEDPEDDKPWKSSGEEEL